MSDAPPSADAPSAVGTLRQALRGYRRRLVFFTALVAIPAVPFGVFVVVLAATAPDNRRADEGIQFVENVGSLLLVLPLANAAVAWALAELQAGRRPTVAQVYGEVLPRLAPLVATVLTAGVLVVIGLFALIVPGLILLVLLVFSAQVVVIEHRYMGAALARSIALVRPAWRRVTLLSVLVILLSFLVGATLGLLVTPFTGDMDDHDLRILSAVLRVPADLVVLPIGAIALTSLFLELRREHPA